MIKVLHYFKNIVGCYGLCICLMGINAVFGCSEGYAQTSHFMCTNLTMEDLKHAEIIDIEQAVSPSPGLCIYTTPVDYIIVQLYPNPQHISRYTTVKLENHKGAPMYIVKNVMRCRAVYVLENMIITVESSNCDRTEVLMAYIIHHKL